MFHSRQKNIGGQSARGRHTQSKRWTQTSDVAELRCPRDGGLLLLNSPVMSKLLWMQEILHQLIGGLSMFIPLFIRFQQSKVRISQPSVYLNGHQKLQKSPPRRHEYLTLPSVLQELLQGISGLGVDLHPTALRLLASLDSVFERSAFGLLGKQEDPGR